MQYQIARLEVDFGLAGRPTGTVDSPLEQVSYVVAANVSPQQQLCGTGKIVLHVGV